MLKQTLLAALVLSAFLLLTDYEHPTQLNAATPRPAPAPKAYPQGYFSPPLANNLRIAGDFGELRPNHFHAGLDLVPSKGVGEPIYAAADGYICRARVMPGAYGNVLYMRHTNGYTTLYAHQVKFESRLQSYIRDVQLQTQLFAQDLTPDSTLFRYKKGEIIGYVGNTGSSTGAHLHFEIRDEHDVPINPMLCNILVDDQTPPTVSGFKIYSLDAQNEELSSKYYPLKYNKKTQTTSFATEPVAYGNRIGIAIHTTDATEGRKNRVGVYGVRLYADGIKMYDFSFNEVSNEDTRYINAHMDYRDSRDGRRLHRCFRLPGNYLSLYDDIDNGIITLQADHDTEIRAEVKDFMGNESTFSFTLRPSDVLLPPKLETYNTIVPYDLPYRIDEDGASFMFTGKNFYTPLRLNVSSSKGTYSRNYNIGDADIPVHNPFAVLITPQNLPDSLRDKAFICVSGNALETTWVGTQMSASAQRLGTFSVRTDTKAPRISIAEKLNKKTKRLDLKKNISFRASDDFVGIGTYRAILNGQWVLMSWDYKSDLFTVDFAENRSLLLIGENQIHVEIGDKKGNIASYDTNFWFSE